jgi:hypothetical protein
MKTKTNSLLRFALGGLLAQSIASPAWTYVPNRQTELQIFQIRVVKPIASFTSEDVARIVPLDINAQTPGSTIGRQMLERSAQMILNGPAMRDTGLGKAATSIEQAGKADLALGASEDGIKHNVNVEYRAFENLALVRYTGLLNLNVRYSVADRGYDVQIEDRLGQDTQLVLSHQTLTATSQVRVYWEF